ncbi:electron transport complex subunit RsxB [Methylibium petroleiphilum]|uniref:electron transport complex subunit RsxB n=1 Tax=Methylibium petroleiphilum TaxID=105560 RepID=UPI001AC3F121|nr:electron transport complex subunit RsxB [Methylibium petroleiphilum]MBN9206293.1 electron transport complex subunit RsxB [Methylibium petroleiphilum]
MNALQRPADAPDARQAALADAIDAALPQTQCTRCGEPDCRRYAEAVATGRADINQCPPGGAEGIVRLAALTGRAALPLNPANGSESPRRLAVIDETWCIGCTLCIKACPVDCIVGAAKQMHTIIESQCTGCELCIPVCPVDCISLENATQTTGWAAWSPAEADAARARYTATTRRRERARREHDERLAVKAAHKLAHLDTETKPGDADETARKRAVIEAAMARARARR